MVNVGVKIKNMRVVYIIAQSILDSMPISYKIYVIEMNNETNNNRYRNDITKIYSDNNYRGK